TQSFAFGLNRAERQHRRDRQARGGLPVNCSLGGGVGKVYPILYFGVGEWNFVTEGGVQGGAGGGVESNLRRGVGINCAQAAGEIAAALEKENWLADFETCKRICERRIDENEKAVAGDSL